MRERVRQRGLADAGHVFDQQVAAREQAGERQSHRLGLAEDDPVQGGQRGGKGRRVHEPDVTALTASRGSC